MTTARMLSAALAVLIALIETITIGGCGRKSDPIPPPQARGPASHGLSSRAVFQITSRPAANHSDTRPRVVSTLT